MEYLEALERENNQKQRQSRRKSSTNKSMEDPTIEKDLFEECETSETDSDEYHHFQAKIFIFYYNSLRNFRKKLIWKNSQPLWMNKMTNLG
jgi:hypothetical protein